MSEVLVDEILLMRQAASVSQPFGSSASLCVIKYKVQFGNKASSLQVKSVPY